MSKKIMVPLFIAISMFSLFSMVNAQIQPLLVTAFYLEKDLIDTRGFTEGCQLIQEVIHVYLHTQNQIIQLAIWQYDDASKTIKLCISDNGKVYSWNVQISNWEYIGYTLAKHRWYQIVVSYNGATKNYYVDIHYYLSKNRLVYQFQKSNYFPLNCHYVFNFSYGFFASQDGEGCSVDHIKFESMSNLGRWFTNFHEDFNDANFLNRWSKYSKNANCYSELVNWDYYGTADKILRHWWKVKFSSETWQDTDFSYGTTYWNSIIYSFMDVPPSWGKIENGMFSAYAHEGQGDEWGDILTAQGKKPHSSQYYKTALINEWYIPYDTPDGEFYLTSIVMQTDHPYWLAPPYPGKAVTSTAGCCVFLIFNMEYEREDGTTAWLFNWEDPDPWSDPNCFYIEIFYERWIFESQTWKEVTYHPLFNCRIKLTSHDSDWHRLCNFYNLGDYNNWHVFTDDLGALAREEMNAQYWGDLAYQKDPLFYRFTALKLYTVSVAVEVIGCEWGTVKFDYVALKRYF